MRSGTRGAVGWLTDLLSDARFALRVFRQSPAFTLTAVVTLAVGIGASTAMFSVADGLLFRPPPFAHSDRLYWIYDVNARLRLTTDDTVPPSPANFLDWRRRTRAFDHMVAWRNWFFSVAGTHGGDPAPEQVRGVTISPGFFDMLGVQAAVGRTFRRNEEDPGRDGVVVLTDGFWQRRFGGDPAILGQSVIVDGRPRTVIGVLPKDFYFIFRDSAIFLPMTVDGDFEAQRATHNIVVLGRLAAGVTRRDAQSDMERIARDLAEAYADTNDGWSAALLSVFPLNKQLRPALLMLVGAVLCLQLIACINIGNLLLARGGARRRELTVRTALGASRGRLIRQMFGESAVLAVIGAMLGVALAAGSVRLLSSWLPEVKMAGARGVTIDMRVLAATVAVTVVTALLLGTLPALKTVRTEQLRVSGESHQRSAAGMALSTIEVALALMLLVGATLLIRSLWNLERVDPGFRPDRLTTMQLWLPGGKYPDSASVSRFYEELLRRVRDVRGVAGVALVNTRPFLGWSLRARLQVPGHPSSAEDDPIVDLRIISADYLATLRARLARGRSITDRDRQNTLPVALVNATMARRFWPAGNPIGQAIHIRLLGPKSSGTPWWPEQTADEYSIIGVVDDMKESRLNDQVRPVAYLSYTQNPSRFAQLLVRAEGPPLNVLETVQRQLQAIDANLGLYDVQPMEHVIEQSVASDRLNAVLLWVFALAALMLCAVGIYGVTSYVVTRRTHEFPIRLAIGARPSSIFQLMTREGATMAAAGIALGVAGALGLARIFQSFVFGLAATDVLTIIASAVIVFAIAMSACWRPAWRATTVDPITVLRNE